MATGEADQACLDKTLLADANGITRFKSPSEIEGWQGFFDIDLVIPSGFKCNHCVFQVSCKSKNLLKLKVQKIFFIKWKYNTGNSHGYDFVTGEYCLGCGAQEQFYGCADIRITDGVTVTDPPNTTAPPTQGGQLWSQVRFNFNILNS